MRREEVKVLGKWRNVKWWDAKKLKCLASEEGKVMRREEVKVLGKWRR